VENFSAVILAAGKGTRMKTKKPKVLHCIAGKPLLGYVLDAVLSAGVGKCVVVGGYGFQEVAEYVKKHTNGNVVMVYQKEQLGTAHALMQAESELGSNEGHVLVVCGDTPLITSKTLANLMKCHIDNFSDATVLTTMKQDPTGYGRIIRDSSGKFKRIVEQKDASSEELRINEINTGIYCFSLKGLFDALKNISADNAQKEYYLTDIIELYNKNNRLVCAYLCEDEVEVMGVNDLKQLSDAEHMLRKRLLNDLMYRGVRIIDPSTVYIDESVLIEPEVVIYPNTIIEGSTKIGSKSVIGPSSRIIDCDVGENCTVQYSVVRDSVIGDNCTVGPFANIRPGSKIGSGVKIGDFVEVKKSQIGDNSKVPHLSYIGDAVIGADVNIGAGTITCNYDGKDKHTTVINDGAFIGSNTSLVAPVEIGARAVVAAGSTITKNVPDNALGVARQRQVNKEGWAKRKLEVKGQGSEIKE